MSLKQVQALYPGAKKVEDGFYVVSDRILNQDVTDVFHFAADRLTVVAVSFDTKHVETNQYLDDFHNVGDILNKKYGDPSSDGSRWNGDLYKDDPQHWGMAVAIGQLTMYQQWSTAKTDIEHILKGDNFHVDHHVRYASRELEHVNEEQKAQDDASKL